MDATRTLERTIFDCPEVNSTDYQRFPLMSDDAIRAMEMEFSGDPSAVFIFPYVNKNTAGEGFVEIYIWDQMLYPAGYERFVICEGLRMGETEEERFLHYINEPIVGPDATIDRFLRQAAARFQQWHLPHYLPQHIGIALEHMYFASHRSGAREILYKAGLVNIARNLDRLPEYNLIGATPEEIIGHDLPLKLLQTIDRSGDVDELLDEERMDRCREVFRRCSGYIGEEIPSTCQWQYLTEVSLSEGIFAGETFDPELYDRLEYCYRNFILGMYKRFIELRAEYPYLRSWQLPTVDEVGNMVVQLETVHKYQVLSGGDDAFKRRKKTDEYSYSGAEYSVIMPGSAFDLCLEAVKLRNSVMELIKAHANGDSTILFLRRTAQPDRPYVTMEVKGRWINQVYGSFDQPPRKDVYLFLEKYARKVWLTYDPCELISESFDEYDIDDELREYMDDYRRRINGAQDPGGDDEEYVQLLLEEMFPELFEE